MARRNTDDPVPEEPPDLQLRNEIAEKVIALLFSLRPGQPKGPDDDTANEMAGHAWACDAACLVVARAVLAANGHLENDPEELLANAFQNIRERVEARRSQYFQQKLSRSQTKTGVM